MNKNTTYYSSQIGIWYLSWWSHENDSPSYLHWEREAGAISVEFGEYDSDDKNVLNSHLDWFVRAGIDYIVFDCTNWWNVDGGVIARNIDIMTQLIDSRKEGNAPKYCFAIGGELRSGHLDDHNVLVEMIWAKYCQRPMYYKWKDKPLLINFTDKEYFYWDNDKFSVRYSIGGTSLGVDSEYVKEKGLWGWAFDAQVPNSEVYGITPGHDANHLWIKPGDEWDFSRGEHGSRYINEWLNAIKADRPTIVISSYNDFSEETAIEASIPKINSEGYSSELWTDYYGNPSPYWYEDITKAYIALKHGFLEGYTYREENKPDIYLYKDNELCTIDRPIANKPIIIIPSGYKEWYFNKNIMEN